MKYAFFFFLSFGSLFAADSNDSSQILYSSSDKTMFNKEQKGLSEGVTKGIDQELVAKSSAAKASGTSDIMIADPKVVASDWKDAFYILKSRRMQNLVFTLQDQRKIINVSDIEPLSGGYLMLFTISSVQGTRYQIIKTSDINSLAAE